MQYNDKQKVDQQKVDQQKQKKQTSPYLAAAKEGARRASANQSMKNLNLNNNNNEEEIIIEDVVMEEANNYPVLPTKNNNGQPPQLFKNVDIHEKITKNNKSSDVNDRDLITINDSPGPVTQENNKNNYKKSKSPRPAADNEIDNISSSEDSDEEDDMGSMNSKYAHVTIDSVQKEIDENEFTLHKTQIKLSKIINDKKGKYKAELGQSLLSNINIVESLIRSLHQTKDRMINKDDKSNNNPTRATPITKQETVLIEKRFKIQSDKIPIFNLKNITGGNKFYTPDHGNTRNKNSNHIIYNDVQEYLDNFEQLFQLCDTDIEKHWKIVLQFSFGKSEDTSTNDWLKLQLDTKKDKYNCWKDMKEKLIKQYMEVKSIFDYKRELFNIKQIFGEPIMTYMQRFIILLTEAKMSDDYESVVLWYNSLQSYCQKFIKQKLVDLNPTKYTTSNGDPLQEDETLESLLDLLEENKTMINKELLEICEKEFIKNNYHSRHNSSSNYKRPRPTNSQHTNYSTDDSNTKKAKIDDIIDDKDKPRTYIDKFGVEKISTICNFCKKDYYDPDHKCKEFREYMADKERRRLTRQTQDNNYRQPFNRNNNRYSNNQYNSDHNNQRYNNNNNNFTGTFAKRRNSFQENLNDPENGTLTPVNNTEKKYVNMVYHRNTDNRNNSYSNYRNKYNINDDNSYNRPYINSHNNNKYSQRQDNYRRDNNHRHHNNNHYNRQDNTHINNHHTRDNHPAANIINDQSDYDELKRLLRSKDEDPMEIDQGKTREHENFVMNDDGEEDQGKDKKLCNLLKTTRRKAVVDTNEILIQNPYSPLSPFIIDNNRELALIDSGSNISLLSLKLINKLKLKINKFPNHESDKIILADDQSINLLGLTDPVTILYNGKNVTHAFNIIEKLGNNLDALFGCDMFPKLGITLSGVAYNYDDNKINYDDSIIDEKYQPNISNAGTPEDHAKLMKALEPNFARNRAINVKELCPHPLAEIKIETLPNKTAYRRQYDIAPTLMDTFDTKVAEWLEKGIVVKAEPSAYNSPITFTKKVHPNGEITHKPALDIRLLNEILVPESIDNYPIKKPQTLYQQTSGCAIYSCLDISNAFMRCPVREKDQVKLTFQHRNKSLMFRSCPYGVKFVASQFTRLVDDIIGDLNYTNSYIDDIYVFTKENDMALHLKQLQTVINRLTDNKLILNFDKAHIAKDSIIMLGKIISKQGLSICTKRLTNIMDLPLPKTGKEMQRALGMFNYMREHIPLMSRVSWRLDELRTCGDRKIIDWTPKLIEHFDTIKNILASRIVLSPADYTQPFIVAVDASAHAIGSCLFQDIPSNETNDKTNDTEAIITKRRFIGFHSRALSSTEQRWPVHRREMAGLLMALKVYDQFLYMQPFKVLTDNRALTYLFAQTPINFHFAQYFDTFLKYDFTIEHLPGVLNVLPDHLSRLYPSDNDLEEGEESNRVHNTRNTEFKLTKRPAEDTTHKPTNLPQIKQTSYIQADHKFSDKNYVEVPEDKREQLLKETHDESGHFGADNIVSLLKNQNLTFPNMLQEAIKCVSKCPKCIKFNIKKRGYSPMRSYWAYLPGDGYVFDLAGPFQSANNKYTYLMIMVDVCTRFCILKPIVDKTAKTVADAMIKAFAIVGLPRFFVASDHGSEFSNELHDRLFLSMDVEKRYSTVYHPQGNGIAERAVQTTKKTLAKLIEGSTEDWSEYIPIVQLMMNNKVSKALQTSPFSLFFARDMNAPITYTDKDGKIQSKEYMTEDELLKRIDYMSQIVFPAIAEKRQMVNDLRQGKVDEKNIQVHYPNGSIVMARVKNRYNALSPVYEGPYKVVRRNNGNAYILRDEEGMIITRNFVAEELKAVSRDSVIPKSELYEIEAIIKDSGDPKNRQYLVKWKNFSKEHNSWVKAKDFTDTDYINAYWRRVQKDSNGNKVEVEEKFKNNGTKRRKLTDDVYTPSQRYETVMDMHESEISRQNENKPHTKLKSNTNSRHTNNNNQTKHNQERHNYEKISRDNIIRGPRRTKTQ